MGFRRTLPGREVGPEWSSVQMFLALSSATLIATPVIIFISLVSGLVNMAVAHSQQRCVITQQKMLRAEPPF